MWSFIANVLCCNVMVLGVVATVLFRYAASRTPEPYDGERAWSVLKRLLIIYRATWRTVLASPFFWAGAGVVTAFIIAVQYYSFVTMGWHKLP